MYVFFACKSLSHHFIDCLGVFLGRLSMRVTETVLCILWPSTAPVYLSHWTSKSRPLTSAVTSDWTWIQEYERMRKLLQVIWTFYCIQENKRIKSSDKRQVPFSSYKVKLTFETCSLQYMSIKWYCKWDSMPLI